MIKNFELSKPTTALDSHEICGTIHVVGADSHNIEMMSTVVSKMDSTKTMFPYSVKDDDGQSVGLQNGFFVYVKNILTQEVYVAKAYCDEEVTQADLAKFIVSIELDLKRKLAYNIRCLAVNSPELCFELLSSSDNVKNILARPFNKAAGPSVFGVIRSAFQSREKQNDFVQISEQVLGNDASRHDFIENFVDLCNAIYNKEGKPDQLKMADKIVDRLLNEICNQNEAKMVNFVREHSQDRTFFKNFVYECLDPEQLSTKAQVTIYVRRKSKEEAISKNLGHYRFFTEKGGVQKPLKFGRELSNVYMLMYLIDHVKEPIRKQPIDLKRNIDEFKRLYRDLFKEFSNDDRIKDIVSEYFHRTDKYGNMRSGRKSEYIDAIRKTMQEQFEEYNESYLPYIMTGSSHLHVPVEKIVFEEDAKEALLSYNFV